MLLSVHKLQLEFFCHLFQVRYKFPQLLDLSATVDIRLWKEALLELNTSSVVVAMKCMSPESKLGGQHYSLAHRQTFHQVFDLCMVGGFEFLPDPIFSIFEKANHGVRPNQDMNERTKEIFQIGLWSPEIHLCINTLTVPQLYSSILWWRGRPPFKCPPVGHLYVGGLFDLLWRSRSFQISD